MKILVFPYRPPNPYFEEFNRSLRLAGIQDVRLASVLRFRSSFDIMHFHFPDQVVIHGSFLRSVAVTFTVLCLMCYAVLTKRPIVWMVHDVNPLWVRRRRALSIFMRLFKYCTSGYVFLSESSKKEFYNLNPRERDKVSVLVHITRYKKFEFDEVTIRNLREQSHVGEGGMLISILGDIKPHKGSACIPLVPSETSSGVKVSLAVCGRVDSMKEEAIERLLSGRPRNNYIRVNKKLEDDELALWIQSSDAVFLPYLISSNSSMAINVLSNHSRIISSDIPIFRELRNQFGDSWIRTVDVGDKNMMTDVISDIPSWKKQPRDFDRLENVLRNGDVDQTGRHLLKFYDGLCLSSAQATSGASIRD